VPKLIGVDSSYNSKLQRNEFLFKFEDDKSFAFYVTDYLVRNDPIYIQFMLRDLFQKIDKLLKEE